MIMRSFEETGGDEDGEEALRRALGEAAAGIEPAVWPARAIRERAARRRRARRIAVTLPVVAAAAAVCAGLLTGGAFGSRGATPVVPAASSAAPRPVPSASASPAVSWPEVRVVAPGRMIRLGHGVVMRLDHDGRCMHDDVTTEWTCKSVVDGNQPSGNVGLQTQGGADSVLYTPLYVGPGHPARIAVDIDGHRYPAQVVTLAGDPNYATAYVWAPPSVSQRNFVGDVEITVWDGGGKVLASFKPPS